MDIREVKSLEDFVLYKLAHGYDFARHEYEHVGYYWLWKAGLVNIEGVGKASTVPSYNQYVPVWMELLVDVDSNVGAVSLQRSTAVVYFPLDCPLTDEVIKAYEYN